MHSAPVALRGTARRQRASRGPRFAWRLLGAGALSLGPGALSLWACSLFAAIATVAISLWRALLLQNGRGARLRAERLKKSSEGGRRRLVWALISFGTRTEITSEKSKFPAGPKGCWWLLCCRMLHGQDGSFSFGSNNLTVLSRHYLMHKT